MASHKRQRDEWNAMVDAIATERPLPQIDVREVAYKPTNYLPAGFSLSDETKTFLGDQHTDFQTRSAQIFQPQMTFEEAMHARPMPPRTIDNIAKQAAAASSAREDTTKTFRQEGPNFVEAFPAVAKASGSSSRRELDMFAKVPRPSIGIIAAHKVQTARRPDFMPIIIVPSAPSSPVQLFNVQALLELGQYSEPHSYFVDEQTGAPNRVEHKNPSVVLKPGSMYDPDKYRVKFTKFQVTDDPRSITNWENVCGCIVTGALWQFDEWFPHDPAKRAPNVLFSTIRGFLAYFEEDKIPQKLKEWKVHPVILTRKETKANNHLAQVTSFWEQLYTFMDTHPTLRHYTIPTQDDVRTLLPH